MVKYKDIRNNEMINELIAAGNLGLGALGYTDHAHSGAILAFQILKDMDMEPKDIGIILGAIGNHDENTGCAVDPVSAAIILADKTDVRRNRVRNKDITSFDNHDRVNYAAMESKVTIHKEKQIVELDITLDENICSVLEYFEIFLNRMLMCRRAAQLLHVKFKFTTNGNKVY